MVLLLLLFHIEAKNHIEYFVLKCYIQIMEGVYGIFTCFRKIIPLKRFVRADDFILYRRSFFMKNTPVWKTYIF